MSAPKALIISSPDRRSHLLLAHLKEQKIDVHILSDTSDALKYLEKDEVDLILVDKTHYDGSMHSFEQKAPHALLLLLDLFAKTMDTSLINAIDELKSHQTDLIATSKVMQNFLQDAKKIANSHANVFITGESGTGKEVIASYIHKNSPRKKAPYLKVNCAAIPESLIEAEFFGHEKGAFTGAISRRLGRFELADKGTLLLDEISEIPLSLQAKLLRAAQEGEFERLGNTQTKKVDVRLISTSNRNLEKMITGGEFREDLYYRLNVVPLELPPLRERKEDIIPLAKAFLKKACLKNQKDEKELSCGAIDKLLEYDFPGNIRELSNLIEHVVVLDKSHLILPEHLPIKRTLSFPSLFKSSLTLYELERWYIEKTLTYHHYNRTKTAKSLGIHVRTLRNKLKQYQDLSSPEPKKDSSK
ncbi:MAG: sigma-54 dependent transcriptional regulator [Simkaniaceae bacterium]